MSVVLEDDFELAFAKDSLVRARMAPFMICTRRRA